MDFSFARSLRFALRMAGVMKGANTRENPAGSPLFRNVIRVDPFGVGSQV